MLVSSTENASPTVTVLTLVVGGAGEIGSAIVQQFLEQGRTVIVLDRTAPSTDKAGFIEVDLSAPSSVRAAFAEVDALGAQVETLIVAAGFLRPGAFLELSDQDIQDHLDVNLLGAFRVAQAASERMLEKGGRIVFLTSIHGQIGVPNRTAYAISKAAIGALVRAMAVELSQHRIRVNAVAPGAVDGGMTPNAKTRDYWVKSTPAHRVAELEEVARFVTMLASQDASFLSGQTIALDGGASNLRLLE